jgi:hypothetical protein
MWELFKFGANPYTSMSNSEVIEAVLKGYRLPRPDNCPENVWQIIVKCWEQASQNYHFSMNNCFVALFFRRIKDPVSEI